MASIDEILTSLSEGKIDVPSAAEQIKAVMDGDSTNVRPAPEDGEFAEAALTRFADKEDEGYEASFNRVTAAWIGDKISDGQYHSIREAVLPNGGKKEAEPEQGSALQPESKVSAKDSPKIKKD